MLRQPTHLQEGEVHCVSCVLISIKQLVYSCFHLLQHNFLHWTRSLSTCLLLGTLTDLARGKSELVAENALLRQRLIKTRQFARLTDVAAVLNFSDQSHFIRDIKAFSGMTPTSLAQQVDDFHHEQAGYSYV
jgi:AraC-like DNA-binding protein